jgi:hypothetical protein
MRLLPPQRLLEQINELQLTVNAHRFDDALAMLLAIQIEAKKAGMFTATIHWLSAMVRDYREEWVDALVSIQKGLFMDPLSSQLRNSLAVIAGRVRDHLQGVDETDDTIPTYWQLLAELGECDLDVHLLMARHLGNVGKTGQALELVEAIVLLNPSFADAWAVKGMLAGMAGDTELSALALAEAGRLGFRGPSFTTPKTAAA